MKRTPLVLLAGTLLAVGGTALAQPMTGGPAGPRHAYGLERMLDTFDVDGTGSVTQEEIDAFRSDRHAAFDADGNGVLSLEEFEALWLDATRSRMVRRFQTLDADGDGEVTVDEFQRPFSRMLSRLDTAEDGVLTRDDVRRHWQAQRERRAGRHHMYGHGRRGADEGGRRRD